MNTFDKCDKCHKRDMWNKSVKPSGIGACGLTGLSTTAKIAGYLTVR
jgi:hypothetical protein